MQLDRLRRAQVAASVLRRARAGVLQTFQKWPEIAGSKYGSLQNQVRDFKGLARKPLCVRYVPVHHPRLSLSVWA